MKPLRLNHLWLEVFSHGGTSLPGTPFSPTGDSPDLLAYALKITRGTGIGVFPVLNLLRWGPKPGPAADLNILGITSSAQPKPGSDTAAADDMAVSVFSSAVVPGLTSLLKSVVREPGIAGLVWRATAPPGYDLPAHSLLPETSAPLDLGYTEVARLSFLRLNHVDPVDITDTSSLNLSGVDVGLPGYDGQGDDPALTAQWRQFRKDADIALLQSLFSVTRLAMPPGVAPRIFAHQDGSISIGADWYGSWDSAQSPLPAARPPWYDLAPGQAPGPIQDPFSQARMQSQIVYLNIPVVAGETASEVADELANKEHGRGWDGVVLDLMTDGFGADQRAELTALAHKDQPGAGKAGRPPEAQNALIHGM